MYKMRVVVLLFTCTLGSRGGVLFLLPDSIVTRGDTVRQLATPTQVDTAWEVGGRGGRGVDGGDRENRPASVRQSPAHVPPLFALLLPTWLPASEHLLHISAFLCDFVFRKKSWVWVGEVIHK